MNDFSLDMLTVQALLADEARQRIAALSTRTMSGIDSALLSPINVLKSRIKRGEIRSHRRGLKIGGFLNWYYLHVNVILAVDFFPELRYVYVDVK